METKEEKSALFTVLKTEMSEKNLKQNQISDAVNKQTQQLWATIRRNTVKFNIIVKICDILGLEIVIRNKKKNCEYIINPIKE